MYRNGLLIIFLLTSYPLASSAQPLSEGVSRHILSDFTESIANGTVYNDCPPVNTPLIKKLSNPAYLNDNLSDEEFVELVGDDVQFFALSGGQYFYDRKAQKMSAPVEVYLSMQGFDISDPRFFLDPANIEAYTKAGEQFTPDQIDQSLPVLCGDGAKERRRAEQVRQVSEQKAVERAKQAAYELVCEVCALRGGSLLQAIYDGNYEQQYSIAQRYLSEMAEAGGDQAMALGVIINALSKSGDLSLLEDLIAYYLMSTSKNWGQQCYDEGAFELTFTTEYPEQVYETLGGIEVGRDAGYTTITKYRVNKHFTEACDRLCNVSGGILLTARIASAYGQTLQALEVFAGINGLLEKYQCGSPQITQFENNLLDLWKQERSEPASVPRNSIASYFK